MQQFLADMPLFVEIARSKSFSKASEALDISASTLSRRIRMLEQQMGILLFYRDTRNVELTPAGALLFERCEYILGETKSAYESAVLNMREPAGLIRIFMYADTYNAFMEKALSRFVTDWPDITMSVTLGEELGDLRSAPYDVAFLVDSAIGPSLVARKLLTIEPHLYAAPSLLERYGAPRVPEDLHNMPCIVLDRVGSRWHLRNGDRLVTLALRPSFTFSAIGLCIEFALAGHGVAMVRKARAYELEESGQLVRVLPEWEGPKHDLSLVTGPGQLPHRVGLFIEHMQNHYAPLRNRG